MAQPYANNVSRNFRTGMPMCPDSKRARRWWVRAIGATGGWHQTWGVPRDGNEWHLSPRTFCGMPSMFDGYRGAWCAGVVRIPRGDKWPRCPACPKTFQKWKRAKVASMLREQRDARETARNLGTTLRAMRAHR